MNGFPSAADRSFVYAVARRYVRDDEDAQDVAQDALLLAYRHHATFRGECNYRTWLYQLTKHAAWTTLRRRRAHQRRIEAVAESELRADDATSTPDHLLDRARVETRLAQAIDTLDEKYRRVLELRVGRDFGEREIATALGISVATVKIRAFRARNMLRASLAA